jgi:O-antigen/teichoic acid export membrane protein
MVAECVLKAINLTDHVDEVPDGGSDAFDLGRSETRRRGLAGVFYLTSSGIAQLLIGFTTNLVLARLLIPQDFGIVALGATAVLFGGLVVDGGLGSGLIRRPEPPTRAELRTLNGIQLVVSLAIALPIAAVALGFGETGAVVAIMVTSLPLATLALPGRLVLTREMRFDRQVVIDFGSQLSMQLFAVSSVVLGAGVWGLAVATVVKAGMATVLTATLGIGLIAPSLHRWREFGDLLRFGLRFSAAWLALIGREQLLNIVIAIVSGTTMLGLWALAWRVLQMPFVLFSSLYQVGFPAMANLLAHGEDPGPVISRTVRRTAISATVLFPAVAAASPELIPFLFGEKWRSAADPIPWVLLGTLILGSISVGASSYLNAVGRPGLVACSVAAFGTLSIPITAVLLPVLDITAIGIGILCGAIAEAVILDRATVHETGVAAYRSMIVPLLIAIGAGGAGWLVCTQGPPGFAIAVAGAAVAFGMSILGLFIACRGDFEDALRLAVEMVRNVVSSS